MAEWIPIGDNFIAADVIRWKEGVFKNRRRKHAKPMRLGERLVTAEVLRDEAGWVYLLVRACEVVSANVGWNPQDVRLVAKNTETKRKRKTIVRGKPERLLWSDESARAVVASKFLGNRGALRSEPEDSDKN